MTSDFGPPNADDLNFFEELERYASESEQHFRPFTVVLIDGSRYKVNNVEQLISYSTMYVLLMEDGREVLFPFPNVCCVEVDA